jgi:hypothetical protein
MLCKVLCLLALNGIWVLDVSIDGRMIFTHGMVWVALSLSPEYPDRLWFSLALICVDASCMWILWDCGVLIGGSCFRLGRLIRFREFVPGLTK